MHFGNYRCPGQKEPGGSHLQVTHASSADRRTRQRNIQVCLTPLNRKASGQSARCHFHADCTLHLHSHWQQYKIELAARKAPSCM